jgi:hypothetical protein
VEAKTFAGYHKRACQPNAPSLHNSQSKSPSITSPVFGLSNATSSAFDDDANTAAGSRNKDKETVNFIKSK